MDERLRIINLGLPKSGTTTLGVALSQAGLKVADWRIRAGQTEDREILFGFVGDHLYRGYYETGDPLALLSEFDAVTEMSIASHGFSLWPQTDWGLIEAIRRHHPNTKFLLSHREPEALVKSMLGWSNLGTLRLPEQSVPGLPAGYGVTPAQLVRWVEGHYSFCRRVFRGDADFLEYDLTDPEASGKISAFLGIELPWWGRANAKDRGEEKDMPSPAVQRSGAAPRRRVSLHVGAHYCGATGLQACLRTNRAALAEKGCAVALPDTGGEGLRLKLPELRHPAEEVDQITSRARREINRFAGKADRLILSDVGIPGRTVHFYGGRFYPATEVRTAALARAFGQDLDHLLYVISPYDVFFSRFHRQRAGRRAVPEIAEFTAGLDGMDRGWPELLEILQTAFRPKRFTVIEAGAETGSDLAVRLLGGQALPVAAQVDPAGEATGGVSITDRALVAIQQGFAADPKLSREEIDRLIASHAEDHSDLGFARLPEAAAHRWRDRYMADLDRIATMPDIALVRC
ncbi:sulfotransferase [Pseudodonghicola xiamenensis]|uniref:Sulfotransferase family protein n=1 Tax=Pseudodonghicola xiamenensis TaxID=337702 RepID=A0A8J3H4K7_9RHOB|nr:sulfotransferase [Pseudodonghicola xiamenensis]GHG79887.1 hypothetical protein GCM10010961_02400 [Pseudodonghicola xiamenensis]